MRPAVPEIEPTELSERLERGEPLQVLDIRAPNRVEAGRIDLVEDGRFHNIVGSRLATMSSPEDLGLDQSLPVAVVCAHGNSSKPATAFLNYMGFDARSLRGGMAGWMLHCVPRALPAPPSLDALIQFDRIGKGALGYLIVSDGEALVVDPPRDVSRYREAAKEADARIVAVADTHCHADYISGGPSFAKTLRVPYYLHQKDAVYPYDGTPGKLRFEPLEDGRSIQVGRAEVKVVHTPGHTEGSVTYLVDDAVALTGDFIFVDSVGRPDLAGKTDEWTETLWQSLEMARAKWSDELLICPAHYASDDERAEDRSVARSFGAIKASNSAMKIEDFESFATWVRSKSGEFPDAYRQIKAVNVGLTAVDEPQAEELEIGRNECAVA